MAAYTFKNALGIDVYVIVESEQDIAQYKRKYGASNFEKVEE